MLVNDEIINFVIIIIIMCPHFCHFDLKLILTKVNLKLYLKVSSFATITLKSLASIVYFHIVTKHLIWQMEIHFMVGFSIHFYFVKIVIDIKI